MKVKCIDKQKNSKGVIQQYVLQDETGRKFTATAKQIKVEMASGNTEFINLQLDKAGRLVDKAVKHTKYKIKDNTKRGKYNYKIRNKMHICIGHELTIREYIDNESSTYRAKVIDEVNIELPNSNTVININKFIEEAENRNIKLEINMGFFKFDDIYEEDNQK